MLDSDWLTDVWTCHFAATLSILCVRASCPALLYYFASMFYILGIMLSIVYCLTFILIFDFVFCILGNPF